MTKIEYLELKIEILDALCKATEGNPTGGVYDQLNRRYTLEYNVHVEALLKAEKPE